MKLGKFYGVGVGPGDAELLTLKAKRILSSANVICAPRSGEDKRSLALSIVRKVVRKKFRVLQPYFPMVKDRAVLEKHWEQAADEIFAELKKGRSAAFVTIGDPLFYSTYSHVLKKIKARGARTETVPGVTSLSSCLAALQLPLLEGEERLAVIPASYGLEALESTAKNFDAIVLMKVSRNYDKIVERLGKLGLKDKAIFLSRCGTKKFFSAKLDEMLGREIDYFSMIIIKR